MYSDVKSVQILVALLKKYGIRYAVLSSGTCSIPVIHSMEIDDFFTCFSDIDERSAVYFAIGIAQMKKEAVAVVCTSGTATCNYLPGVSEARKLNVPIVVITCDKNPNTLDHMTIQKVNQEKMYANNSKFSVTLPVIKDAEDEWAVKTLINQALLEINHHGTGPVHINIYTDGNKTTYTTEKLPDVKKIERYDYFSIMGNKEKIYEELAKKNKILVVVGEMTPMEEKNVKVIEEFAEKYNAVILAEHVANFNSENCINAYKLLEQISLKKFLAELSPDLIISMGGNYASYGIKSALRGAKADNWWIDPQGQVVDTWRSLKKIFECSIFDFFQVMVEGGADRGGKDHYLECWKKHLDAIKVPKSKFTSLYVVNNVIPYISNCSLVHLGILNATRLFHLFDIPKETRVYSNLGALGIDGSLSSFLGQASVEKEKTCLCIIGDLSFFYDINSLYKTELNNNIRIILLNNGGGSEFHLNTGIKKIPMLDDYIAAGHSSKAELWSKTCGLQYFTADNESDFLKILDEFMNADQAALLEVITDMEMDAQAIREMYDLNGYSSQDIGRFASTKKFLMKLLGTRKTQKIIKVVKAWMEG